jgi:hypothetical protein
MTYEQQVWRLAEFIKQLGVGFAGVGKRKGQDYWHFVVFLPNDHVVSATGPEQPKIDKTEINRWRRAKKQAGARKAG